MIAKDRAYRTTAYVKTRVISFRSYQIKKNSKTLKCLVKEDRSTIKKAEKSIVSFANVT